VVTKSTPKAPDDEVEESGVNVHRVHLEREPTDFFHEIRLLNAATERRVRKLLEEFRSEGKPTLFHAHDWLSLDSARELKYEYKLPMVATVHATEEGRNGGIWTETQRTIHDLEYWLTYEAWRVIVCSEFMKGEVSRTFNCPEDKIEVIHNGIDASKFRFEWPDNERARFRACLASPDEKIVLFVGRFVREKGIQVLLGAAGAILAREPGVRFVIVGGGRREVFERFVRWYGIEDRVLFTGFLSGRQLHQLYRVADVAVFPSLYEPFGIVALEAMAAGVPVVASDAGGLREVVLHGETGVTSYAGNAESLAWAVLHALEDPKRARRMCEAATDRLSRDFDWSLLARRTIGVYERVWMEFMNSWWAQETLWPVTPGAEERAERLRVRELAERGEAVAKPFPQVAVPEEPVRVSYKEHEEDAGS